MSQTIAPAAGELPSSPVDSLVDSEDPCDPDSIRTLERSNSECIPVARQDGPAETPAESAPAPARSKPQPLTKLQPRRPRVDRRFDLPAWCVSALVHCAVLGSLAFWSFTNQSPRSRVNLDTALVETRDASEELTPILADPAETPRDQAVGDTKAAVEVASFNAGIGSPAPSASPLVGGAGSGTPSVGERTILPQIAVVRPISGLSVMPSSPTRDLALGGGIAGDVAFAGKDVGEALDQLAREILRHLEKHRLTVIWLFDESESMKDDQLAIREKFSRVASELKINVDPAKKDGPLSHAVVGFGAETHFELEKPTIDIDRIGRSIEQLRVDPSGLENTMGALRQSIQHYAPLIRKDRKLIVVLVTDESCDDGGYVEEARRDAIAAGVPIYVIGRQSMFGYPFAHLRYTDPVTKEDYYPQIRRGPETADVEALQWDGLHDRWDEQPSGFAPYELARLAKDTGGIYFLLPSEENMRARTREKAYSIETLREYLPDYESRQAYGARREASPFRKSLYEIIKRTRGYPFRRHFSVIPAEMIEQARPEIVNATERLNTLIEIENVLKGLQGHRDRETEKRWRAAYDLMLAQIVTYQVKAYEYRACLQEMIARPPTPSALPSKELLIEWVLDHSGDRKAPVKDTEKKYADAARLLKLVIERHPKSPWADLAQDEFNRGFGVRRNEWKRSARYQDREKLVPKY